MDQLLLVSLMGGNADPFYEALAAYLSTMLGAPVRFLREADWTERGRLLEQGEAQLGFICGLPYTRMVHRHGPGIELLAAPVMRADRYAGLPIYFSDVVVRRDSPVQSFDDLRGAVWAYNEEGSHSGYNLVQYHLAQRGDRSGYFGRVVKSGGHLNSVRMVVAGEADASAIDSIVLEMELRERPELTEQVRIVEQLGPSPIPPVVIGRDVPDPVKTQLRDVLLGMHQDKQARAVLDLGLVERFVLVRDQDYDEIRCMTTVAEGVRLV